MFTGIVEELGTVVAISPGAASARITVRGDILRGTVPGDSIAVNGVCLTAVDPTDDSVTTDVMQETLERTALGSLAVGDRVNLERAATLSTRLGGHLVQGHIDGVARVVARQPGEAWDVVTLELPGQLTRYVVEKGSVALDGVSLTVVSTDGPTLTVSLIPETLRRTTWGGRAVGDAVNVEVDVLAKYVERLVRTEVQKP